MPHDELFAHSGNEVGWPPTAKAIPGLAEVAWDSFDEAMQGQPCLVELPWDTQLLWLPQWLSRPDADTLMGTIQDRVEFSQPLLRFERGLQIVEAQQPRRSAWVCDLFNQAKDLERSRAAGQVFEPSVLAAHRIEPWSASLIGQVEQVSCATFNAMLLHSYDSGRHSMGFHSDTDHGLGDRAVIASFSLGATRTFSIRSQRQWQGSRIEMQFPMTHGCCLVMGPGFQSHWLHAVLKEPEVAGARLNGTLRFYDLPPGSALCACGASRQATRRVP